MHYSSYKNNQDEEVRIVLHVKFCFSAFIVADQNRQFVEQNLANKISRHCWKENVEYTVPIEERPLYPVFKKYS
jgi:hypothetical protein